MSFKRNRRMQLLNEIVATIHHQLSQPKNLRKSVSLYIHANSITPCLYIYTKVRCGLNNLGYSLDSKHNGGDVFLWFIDFYHTENIAFNIVYMSEMNDECTYLRIEPDTTNVIYFIDNLKV